MPAICEAGSNGALSRYTFPHSSATPSEEKISKAVFLSVNKALLVETLTDALDFVKSET